MTQRITSAEWKRLALKSAERAQDYRDWAATARQEGRMVRCARYEGYAATSESDAVFYERQHFDALAMETATREVELVAA